MMIDRLAAANVTTASTKVRATVSGTTRVRRLGWAGIEIECDGETLVIDYVLDKTPMAPLLRNPDEPFPSARPGRANIANALGHGVLSGHLSAGDADRAPKRAKSLSGLGRSHSIRSESRWFVGVA